MYGVVLHDCIDPSLSLTDESFDSESSTAVGLFCSTKSSRQRAQRKSELLREEERCPHRKLILQQGDEGRRSDDVGGLVALQGEERLVASYEELSVPGFGESEQVVVIGIGRDLDLRELFHSDRQVSKAVDEPASKGGREAGADFWITCDTRDFIDLLGGGHEIEVTAAP